VEKFDKTKNVVYECAININQLTMKQKNIEYALGYRHDNAPLYIKEEIQGVLRELDQYNDIRAGFKIVFEHRFVLKEHGFSLGNIYFKSGNIIASHLKESEHIVIFLATAGYFISKKMEECNRSKNYMKAYIYDVVGSEIAEGASDFIQSLVKKEVKKINMSTTNRYSPGYCGWDVAEQHKLFSFLPKHFCHVSLTESALMIPIKSVSGIIGIGEKAVQREYGCSLCTMKTCYKRRELH
jgi:hypothetical protein